MTILALICCFIIGFFIGREFEAEWTWGDDE